MNDVKRKITREFKIGEAAGLPDINVGKGKRPILFISDLAFSPPTDVWETDQEIRVMMEIAHLQGENFRVTYSEGYLMIEGHRPEPSVMSSAKIMKFYKKEIDYGKFSIKIKMNTRIRHEEITANYQNGLLSVILPINPGQGSSAGIEVPVNVLDGPVDRDSRSGN
ncbi:MAG: Hsp20/alpha crystallin family protein [Calditrichia bacterium]